MRSHDWLLRQKKDIFVKEAANKGYLSRSAFKLVEIDRKFNLISKSKIILELGSSPGGWSQVLCEKNSNLIICAIDIKNMSYKNQQINFFKMNFLEFDYNYLDKFDLILSDIAPNTTGHKSTDHLRIISLVENIIIIVEKKIKKGGNFVFKIWKGSEDKKIINNVKKKFASVSLFKPDSSRKQSSEIYVVAKKFIG